MNDEDVKKIAQALREVVKEEVNPIKKQLEDPDSGLGALNRRVDKIIQEQ